MILTRSTLSSSKMFAGLMSRWHPHPVAAEPGASPTFMDVCIKGVSIRADELGAARAAAQPTRWPIGMTISLLVIVVASGALWFWLRWRRVHSY